MSIHDSAITHTQDRTLVDSVLQSPIDEEQAAAHARFLRMANLWLWMLTMPWLGDAIASHSRLHARSIRA